MSFRGFLNFTLRGRAVRREAYVIDPAQGPRTLPTFPECFWDYHYTGPAVETIIQGNIRRKILVACLVREARSKDGALIKEEMTASLLDLQTAGHPDAARAASFLHDYYLTHFAAAGVRDLSIKQLSPSSDTSHHAATT